MSKNRLITDTKKRGNVSDEKRMKFDEEIQNITRLIAKEYHRGVDGKWLQALIEECHHPGINSHAGSKSDEYHLVTRIQYYVGETILASDSRKHHLANIDKISRYERFQREVMHRSGFLLNVDTITADDLRDLKRWMQEEHTYGEQFPLSYKDIPESKYKWERSENSITGCFYSWHEAEDESSAVRSSFAELAVLRKEFRKHGGYVG